MGKIYSLLSKNFFVFFLPLPFSFLSLSFSSLDCFLLIYELSLNSYTSLPCSCIGNLYKLVHILLGILSSLDLLYSSTHWSETGCYFLSLNNGILNSHLKYVLLYVRFKVLIAGTMKISIKLDELLCGLVGVYLLPTYSA